MYIIANERKEMDAPCGKKQLLFLSLEKENYKDGEKNCLDAICDALLQCLHYEGYIVMKIVAIE